jgi:hypothetical protein
VETEFERKGTIAKKMSHDSPSKPLSVSAEDATKDTIKVLEGNIGYVNMDNLLTAQVPIPTHRDQVYSRPRRR